MHIVLIYYHCKPDLGCSVYLLNNYSAEIDLIYIIIVHYFNVYHYYIRTGKGSQYQYQYQNLSQTLNY